MQHIVCKYKRAAASAVSDPEVYHARAGTHDTCKPRIFRDSCATQMHARCGLPCCSHLTSIRASKSTTMSRGLLSQLWCLLLLACASGAAPPLSAATPPAAEAAPSSSAFAAPAAATGAAPIPQAPPPVNLVWTAGTPYAPVALASNQTLQLAWTVGHHTVYEVRGTYGSTSCIIS